MAHRDLYIAAYDVADPRRLRHALQAAKAYAVGGQRSAYECYLTTAERRAFIREMEGLLVPEADRFFLLRLDPRCKVQALGIAVAPQDPDYFYVG